MVPVMWEHRRFVKGAETLALAYLASGTVRYGRAAAQRMASISRWDPEGSSYIEHNDEAHMSSDLARTDSLRLGLGPFTDEERERVIAQFRRRGEITFEHMHDRGSYGVSRFDSHAGREIVFLAQVAFRFYEHIPEAQRVAGLAAPGACVGSGRSGPATMGRGPRDPHMAWPMCGL